MLKTQSNLIHWMKQTDTHKHPWNDYVKEKKIIQIWPFLLNFLSIRMIQQRWLLTAIKNWRKTQSISKSRESSITSLETWRGRKDWPLLSEKQKADYRTTVLGLFRMVVWPLYDTTVEETTDLSLISQDNQTCSFDQLPIGEIVICGREKKDANNKMYELWRRNKKNTSMNVNLQPILYYSILVAENGYRFSVGTLRRRTQLQSSVQNDA